MEGLLFLCHRIPYPPNKGDKIRSYHLLCHLSRHYRVYLGTFIDDPADREHRHAVAELCADSYFAEIDPRLAKLASLPQLLRGAPLTSGFYRHRGLAGWIAHTVEQHGLQRALVFSSGVAPFLDEPRYAGLRRVCDLVDVDSDKWAQYSRSQSWPMSWVYRREARTLAELEASIVRRYDASVLVTEQEVALLRDRVADAAPRIHAIHNGVDSEYFQPGDYPDPYGAGGPTLVFTGSMDYWANVDAVCWFADAVLPQLQQQRPELRFAVVGNRPTPAVQRLAERPGVIVTGRVADMRPYLAHAAAAVAPLRIARGVQNKVLEAMAMARPVVVTRAAMDGIVSCEALERLVVDEPAAMAECLLQLLAEGDIAGYGRIGRDWVLRHYHWERNLQDFDRLLEQGIEDRAAAALT